MTIFEAIKHCEDRAKKCDECGAEHRQLQEWMEELLQYREIGTVEEFREAVEKQKPKKPHRNYEKFSGLWCKCGWYLGQKKDLGIKYCPNCGQAIDVENLEGTDDERD